MKKFLQEIKDFFKSMGIKGFLVLNLGCFLYAAATALFISPSGLFQVELQVCRFG